MFPDLTQAQRLSLAGAATFPQPYPTVGAISIEEVEVEDAPVGVKKKTKKKKKKSGKKKGKLKKGKKKKELRVVVREKTAPAQSTTRVVPVKHVAAIFIYTGEGNRVEDFGEGVWVLGPDIKKNSIEEVTKGDADKESCPAGIVFVPEHLSVLTIHEIAERAGSVGKPDWDTYCECEN